MLDIQTFRADQMMHPHPPHRIYDYTLPHFGIQEIHAVIQMDLLGNYKTLQFLLEALRHTEVTDPRIRHCQHILLRAASGWTAHIHIPNNPDPSFFHVWVGTDSLPAAAADGLYKKSLEDLRFHRVFTEITELR